VKYAIAIPCPVHKGPGSGSPIKSEISWPRSATERQNANFTNGFLTPGNPMKVIITIKLPNREKDVAIRFANTIAKKDAEVFVVTLVAYSLLESIKLSIR
jgi:hypothetical protein